eukprot:bmy_04316T0
MTPGSGGLHDSGSSGARAQGARAPPPRPPSPCAFRDGAGPVVTQAQPLPELSKKGVGIQLTAWGHASSLTMRMAPSVTSASERPLISSPPSSLLSMNLVSSFHLRGLGTSDLRALTTGECGVRGRRRRNEYPGRVNFGYEDTDVLACKTVLVPDT